MSQWIRNYKPSQIDADEWGNILVLRENGQKAVYHWEDYNEHYAFDGKTAWMPLPESDIPKSVSVTIEVGNKTYTVENNGFTIEVHDSDDPMGQPTCWQTGDTITGILEAVDGILQVHLNGNEDCGCEDDELDVTALTVEDIEDLIEAEAQAEEMDDVREHLNSLRGKVDMDRAVSIAESMTGVPPHVPKKPWKNKIGSYNVG